MAGQGPEGPYVYVPESAVERGRDLVFEGASALASSHAKSLVKLDGVDESAAILLPDDLHGVKVVARVELHARRPAVTAKVEEVDVRDGRAREQQQQQQQQRRRVASHGAVSSQRQAAQRQGVPLSDVGPRKGAKAVTAVTPVTAVTRGAHGKPGKYGKPTPGGKRNGAPGPDLEIKKSKMSSRMRFVMLMIKDVPKAVRFYNEGLGLPLLRASDRWAELDTGTGPPLALKGVDG